MLTLEQQKERLAFIGASECAAVLGLSRWKTPLEVWAIKTGKIQIDTDEESLAQWWGSELEDAVAKRFCKETGKMVQRVNDTLFHKQYPFIACNLDRRVVAEDAILECKTASAWKSKDWQGEEIPQEYILQCYHQLAVCGKRKCYLAVAIGNQDFKIKEIERDEKIIADIVKREVDFWENFVLKDVMPTVITKDDTEVLNKLYPQALIGKEVVLPDVANIIIETLQGYKSDLKNLEGLIEKSENELKSMIKENEIGITPLYKIGWSNSKWSGLDGPALKVDLPLVWTKYYKSKPTRRFTIKKLLGDISNE